MWACRGRGPEDAHRAAPAHGRPGAPASPDRDPKPPPEPETEAEAEPSSSSSSSSTVGPFPALRMARRPEVLCGAAAVLGCALLVAFKVTCSRAKDVTMPAKLPVNFFSPKSPVHDFFLGQLDRAEHIRQDSEIALFFFYAPWCGQSVAVREEIEAVASRLADQVLFVAVNCWWNHGKCRKQKHFFYFPVIYLYHRSFGPIEYKGPMHAVYIEKFVRRVMSPLLYISSRSKLQQFLSSYEPCVLGYFEFNASPQPPGYLTFFTSALHSLNKDHLGSIHFGVITNKQIAREISLASSGSIYLHRQVNTSLLFPHAAANYTAEGLWRWAVENRETFLRWLTPHGGKSLLLHSELKKGPALFLFLPFDPLADSHPLVEEVSRLALEYNRCNRSRPGGPEEEGAPLPPLAEGASIAAPPCCNTVVLPPQWHSLSRSHNVCELCLNQTAGVRPRHLGWLRCNFLEMEVALDAFYLTERTFFPVVAKAASLCRNFLSYYSPFSYYTACCRTVGRAPPKAPAPPVGVSRPPRGESWDEEAPNSVPHIEGGNFSDSLPCGSALTGLSCRTNKTLNLYLLDSGLFWTFAVRLGASRSALVKEFAAIVDLQEETHYVLDQERPLLTSHLETFIQNYSALYSPLKRHLVGDPRSSHAESRHRIRDVTTSTFPQAVLRSGKDVLLVYYAPWCGFCASLHHIFIHLARILPPDNFMVARVDVSQNDLPWEFMTDHVPHVLFFPRGRKAQSVPFPPDAPLTLPNLLRFALHHSSPPPPGSGAGSCPFQSGRVSHLEREVEKLRAERQALHRAQAQLQGQLREAKREGRWLQQEARALREHQSQLETQRERLRGLYEQKAQELEGMAEKLQELADASERLLAENAFLKVLLASAERKRGATWPEPESSLSHEEAGLAAAVAENRPEAEEEEDEEEGSVSVDSRIVPAPSQENWTE